MPITEPNHPILPIPPRETLWEMGEVKVKEFLEKREEWIHKSKIDPLNYGWEPTIWKVCDCLFGFPWVPAEEAAAVRKSLGFEAPVEWLAILGGNRGGKTEYAAKRGMKILTDKAGKKDAWIFHTDNDMSVKYHQSLYQKYLPPNLRAGKVRTASTYLSYTMQNGFSNGKFVLPNSSVCEFRNYQQDIGKIEGGEIDFAACDELVPLEWIDTMDLRLATRKGKGLVTFTPVEGYTPTVASFIEGATVALKTVAWLLPKDGGEPDMQRACVCEEFVLEDVGGVKQLCIRRPRLPEGREFQEVPRVLRCADTRRALVYFHTSDNPYGNPKEVASRVMARGESFIKERFYGIATKQWSARFSVSDTVHVVRPTDIPKEGSNYFACDPSSARNWFMLWGRATRDGKLYIYREWPSQCIPVQGQGVPGPWAVFDGKKLDGKPGPGQRTFGFGLIRYKEEVAKLEGWTDAVSETEGAAAWREMNGSRESVVRRVIDSRFASAPRVENDRPKTLITEMEELGLWLDCASGAEIGEGEQFIIDALHYDARKPIGWDNSPRLYISSECKNLLFALRTWTGVDGNKGATKDPVDVLRYLLLAEPVDLGSVPAQVKRGGGF